MSKKKTDFSNFRAEMTALSKKYDRTISDKEDESSTKQQSTHKGSGYPDSSNMGHIWEHPANRGLR